MPLPLWLCRISGLGPEGLLHVLLGDFNENVYTGRLTCRLAQDDPNFTKICRHHTDIPIPPTFWTRSAPIDGIFTTSGIETVNAFILPHLGGIGDHWCFIIDLPSEPVIGSSFPNTVWCAARKIHFISKWMIMIYDAELTCLCKKHNMFHCMDMVFSLTAHLIVEDFLLLMYAWANKFKEYMIHSENQCSKLMMGHIEWCPAIGTWLNRRWLLHRNRLWMLGTGCPDPQNMFWECYRLHLPDPPFSTLGAICAQIMVPNRWSDVSWRMLWPSDANISLTWSKMPRSMMTQSVPKQY